MKKDEYLELPWDIEHTIEHLDTIRDYMQEDALLKNSDGRGKEDVKEIAFDFNRASAALQKQIPRRPYAPLTLGSVGTCPACSAAHFSERNYCYHCGQKLDWSVKE